MGKRFLFTVVFLWAIVFYAQQTPQFTQYLYHTASVNPGYAGSRGVLNVTALHRSQWNKIEGSPTTSTLAVSTPLKYSDVSLGFSFVRDQLGYENSNDFFADVSYKIHVGRDATLAFGLKAGISHYNLEIPDANDIYFGQGFVDWAPNIGTGLYLSTVNWYVGVSVPKVLNNDRNRVEEIQTIERNGYYAISGYVFDIAPNIKFRPTTLVKVSAGAPVAYDATASFLFNEKLWVGGSLRFNDSDNFGAFVDFQINDFFRIGYAYDAPKSNYRSSLGNTHEIILIFENRPKKIGGIKSPRYF